MTYGTRPTMILRDGPLFNGDRDVYHEVVVGDAYGVRKRRGLRNVIDLGGHVGCFSCLVHDAFPAARVAAVEVEPDNYRAMVRNCGVFAVTLLRGACTYEPGPLVVMSTVFPGTAFTGGSTVHGRPLTFDPGKIDPAAYRLARYTPRAYTLEDVRGAAVMPEVDLLKLDVEGSEFSILTNADLSGVKAIVGEYHGIGRFRELLAGPLKGWKVRRLDRAEQGIFSLTRP